MGMPLIIAEMPESLQTVTGFFTKGGVFMWPLLVCSIVAVTTISRHHRVLAAGW